ncbi:MAG: hypothetical protein M3548_09090 [Actinomycetota bacterium]|nr:hypothetical protein [Actinomycetota bacterium]
MAQWSNHKKARRVVLAYLAVVVVVFVGVLISLALHDSPDASFAPVLAVVVTLPSSLAVLLLPEIAEPWNGVLGSAVLVAAALVQAWLLWLVFRGERA